MCLNTCPLELHRISLSRLAVWGNCGGQADSSDHNTDDLRLHRCRRTLPWRRCGWLPSLTGPSGCGTSVPQPGSLQRCRARSPTGTPADHWETGREQTHRLSDWPFLRVTIWKKWPASNVIVPLGCLEPGHQIHGSDPVQRPEQWKMMRNSFLPGAVITSTEREVNVCKKILYGRFYVLEMCLNLLTSPFRVIFNTLNAQQVSIFYQWTLLIETCLIKIYRKT